MNLSLVQRYPVATFCTLTILLTFATYLLPLPREALPFVMVLIPAVIAISLAAIGEGASGVRSLLSKLAQWRIGLKWFAIALAVALAMRLSVSVIVNNGISLSQQVWLMAAVWSAAALIVIGVSGSIYSRGRST